MTKEVRNELLENIVQLGNEESIIVCEEIVPVIGNVEDVIEGKNIIQVHRIEPVQNRIGWGTVLFSITKQRDSEWVANLELIVRDSINAAEIYSENVILDDDYSTTVCIVYELKVNLIHTRQYPLECSILEKMGELEREFYDEPYDVYVDSDIILNEGHRTDADQDSYSVEVHEVRHVDDSHGDLNIRFSITANFYTQAEISTVETKIAELFLPYEFTELDRTDRKPDEEEEGAEDAGMVCVIYEMKTQHQELG